MSLPANRPPKRTPHGRALCGGTPLSCAASLCRVPRPSPGGWVRRWLQTPARALPAPADRQSQSLPLASNGSGCFCAAECAPHSRAKAAQSRPAALSAASRGCAIPAHPQGACSQAAGTRGPCQGCVTHAISGAPGADRDQGSCSAEVCCRACGDWLAAVRCAEDLRRACSLRASCAGGESTKQTLTMGYCRSLGTGVSLCSMPTAS